MSWWLMCGGVILRPKVFGDYFQGRKTWMRGWGDVEHHSRSLYTYQKNKIMGFGLYKTQRQEPQNMNFSLTDVVRKVFC